MTHQQLTHIALEDSQIDQTIRGFDRITIWINRPESPVANHILNQHCHHATIEVRHMRYNPRWKTKISLYQPTLQCLHLLATALSNDIAARITYAEIACDIPTANQDIAADLQREFLSMAHVKYQRTRVVIDRGTAYFARRTNQRKHRQQVLTVYSDRPSKLHARADSNHSIPCMHIEWRISGWDALTKIGIVNINDAMQFDHEQFWNERVRFHHLPKWTTLGLLLGRFEGKNNDVSGTALRNRAKRWFEDYHGENGSFVLQNALRGTPKLIRELDPMSFTDWLAESYLRTNLVNEDY